MSSMVLTSNSSAVTIDAIDGAQFCNKNPVEEFHPQEFLGDFPKQKQVWTQSEEQKFNETIFYFGSN